MVANPSHNLATDTTCERHLCATHCAWFMAGFADPPVGDNHTGQVTLPDKGQKTAEWTTKNYLFQGWFILQCKEYSTFIQGPFGTPNW